MQSLHLAKIHLQMSRAIKVQPESAETIAFQESYVEDLIARILMELKEAGAMQMIALKHGHFKAHLYTEITKDSLYLNRRATESPKVSQDIDSLSEFYSESGESIRFSIKAEPDGIRIYVKAS